MTVDLATLVACVIGFTLLEAVALWRLHRRAGRGVAPRDFLVNMVSGICLMSALLAQARQASEAAVCGWLMAAGVAHATDLALRWRRLPAVRGRRVPTPDEVSA